MKKIVVVFLMYPLLLFGSYKTTLDYLIIDSYPEFSAMGENSGVIADRVSALSINPATLSMAKDFEFSAMHNIWPGNIVNEKLTIGKKFNLGNIGSELSYFNFGNFRKILVDEDYMPILTDEEFFMEAYILSFGFANRINNLSFGLKPKVICEKKENEVKYYGAFDFGIIFEKFIFDYMKFGLSVLNISKLDENFSLPINLKGTLAYEILSEDEKFLILNTGASYLIKENYFIFSIGIQYNLSQLLLLRSGLIFDKNMEINLAFGAGIKIENFIFNYSYETLNDIGSINKFSMNVYIDTKKGKESEVKEKIIEDSFENLIKSADYYYKNKQYSKAIKYFEYLNLIYWKELEEKDDKSKSLFYQKLGICYYNIGDKIKAKQYFERALYYDKDNELLKYWLDLIK